jgi:hypothetical protein
MEIPATGSQDDSLLKGRSMGASGFVKALFDSLDKITDILNIGRLIFYTSAGFLLLLPMAMCLRMAAHDPLAPYWQQFLADVKACGQHPAVWFAGLVMGFVIATVANEVVMNRFTPAPQRESEDDTFAYWYPQLYSGGVRPKEGTAKDYAAKDYAAWLISEYYRYVEIVVFIPYAILLSLPVYSVYSLVYLIRTSGSPEGFVLHASHYAFALWTLGWVFAAVVVWPEFWLPRVAEPTYHEWEVAFSESTHGLDAFMKEKATDPAQQPPKPSNPGA